MTGPTNPGFRPSQAVGGRPVGFSRRDAVLGVTALAVLLALLGGLALLVQRNRSSEPEFLGGGAFLAYTEVSPAGFNVVDGDPELRFSRVMRYFGNEGAVGDLVPVNSPAGVFLLDVQRGLARSFTPSYQPRGEPTGDIGLVSVIPENHEVAQRGVVGSGAEARLFVVGSPRGEEGNSVLTIADPALMVTNLPESISSLPGQVEGAVGVGTGVWLTVRSTDADSEEDWQLYRVEAFEADDEVALVDIGDGDADAGDDIGDDADDRDEFEPRRATTELKGSLPARSRLVSANGGTMVASASVVSGEVRFHQPDGSSTIVTVDRLRTADRLIPLRGGDGAWFLAGDTRGWFVVHVRSSDRSPRVADIGDSVGTVFTRGAVIGDVFVAVDAESQVWWVDAGDLGSVTELGAQVRPYPGDDRNEREGNEGEETLGVITVEPYANRIFVNAAERQQALMFKPGSPDPVLLDKGDVPEVVLENAGQPIADIPDTRAEPTPEAPLEIEEAEVDLEQFCEPEVALAPVLLPQRASLSPTSITPGWEFPVRDDFCVPVVEVRVSGGPGGRSQPAQGTETTIDGLEPETDYEVVVVATYVTDDGEREFPSQAQIYRTSEVGPCPVEALTAGSVDGGYVVSWSAPGRGDDCGRGNSGRVVSYEVRATNPGVLREPRTVPLNETNLVIDFEPSNIGRTTAFEVIALGPSSGSSVQRSNEVTGNRSSILCELVLPVVESLSRTGGPRPTFGVEHTGISDDDLAWAVGRRGAVTATVTGDVNGDMALGPPGEVTNADNWSKAGQEWSAEVKVEGCSKTVGGTNAKDSCGVVGQSTALVSSEPGGQQPDNWVVTVTAPGTSGDCGGTPEITSSQPECITRSGSSFTVSHACTTAPTFTVGWPEPQPGFSSPEPSRVTPPETDYQYDLPPGPEVRLECDWNDETTTWECTRQEVTRSFLPPAPVEWVIDNTGVGPWGKQQRLEPKICSASFDQDPPTNVTSKAGSCVFTAPQAPS